MTERLPLIRGPVAATAATGRMDASAARGHQRRSRGFVLGMLTPMFVLLAAFTLFPFVSVIGYAFTKNDLTKPFDHGFAGLSNFAAALTDAGLVYSVLFTALLVAVAVAIEFVVGFVIATLLWRPMRGGRVYLAMLILPFAATPVASYLAWRLMLNPDGGELNAILGAVGLPTLAWTSDPTMAVVSIILVDVWQWSPFITLVMLAGLQALPGELFEAAAIDGAGVVQRIRNIALPMLKPLIAFVVTFRAIDAVRTFDSIWIITNGGPGSATESLVVRIYREAFTNLSIGEAAALGLIFLIVLTVLGRLFAAPALQRLEH